MSVPKAATALMLLTFGREAVAQAIEIRNDVARSQVVSWTAPDALAPHLSNAEAGGASVFSLPIALPPALLAPNLTLVNSSSTGVSREVGFGWTLDGILQIERPVARAFSAGAEGTFGDGEYLVSGDGFSGILVPSGGSGGHVLNSTITNLDVTAVYSASGDSWSVDSSSGEHWMLESIGPGNGISVETGWWRVTAKLDRYGNQILYTYGDYGRIEQIDYGQNPVLGEPSTTRVTFTYPEPMIDRYDGRKGALDELHPELAGIKVTTRGPLGTFGDVTRYPIVVAVDWAHGVTQIDRINRAGFDGTDWQSAPGYDFIYADADVPIEGATVDLGALLEHDYYVPYTDDFYTWDAVEYSTASATDKNETCISSGFYDLNGDGVKEHVIRDWGGWFIHQGIPTEDGAEWDDVRVIPDEHSHDVWDWMGCLALSRSWGHPGTPITGIFEQRTPWEKDEGVSDLTAVNVDLIGLYDVDGDGYLDLVEASGDEHEAGSGSFFISYGATEGFLEEVEVDAPDRYTKSITVTDIEHKESSWDQYFRTLQLFFDADGDGWIDIVRDASLRGGARNHIEVAYHTGERDGGWLPFEDLGLAPVGFDGDSPLGRTLFGNYVPEEALDPVDPTIPLWSFPETAVVSRVVDMNGDGLMDLVGTQGSAFRVAFGLGGRGNGWSVPMEWPGSDIACDDATDMGFEVPCTQWTREGWADGGGQGTAISLLDVNGDGLPDLVDWNWGLWYPNNGSGFHTSSGSGLPDYLMAPGINHLETSSFPHFFVPLMSRTWYEHYRLFALDDLDGDGTLDAATYDWDTGTDLTVTFGTYQEPHVLKEIYADNGRDTYITYTPANKAAPSGDFESDQLLHASFPLAAVIETTDDLTGMSATTYNTFADGETRDQAFLGFASRIVDIDGDPDQEVTYDEAYELNPGLPPLLLYQATSTNWCRPFAPGLDHPCAGVSMAPRVDVTNTYHYTPSLPRSRLLESVVTRVRGDAPGTDDGDYATFRADHHLESGIDADVTFVDWIEYSGPDVDDDFIHDYDYDWVSSDEVVIRLLEESVLGYDTAHYAGQQVQSHAVYTWNEEGGRLTMTEDAGPVGDGASDLLITTFTRDERGQVDYAEDPTGHWQTYTYDFGGAVLASLNDSNLHLYSYEVDSRGRVTYENDDSNGTVYQYAYDGLDRVLTKDMDFDGTVHPLEEHEYSEGFAFPTWARNRTCEDAPDSTCTRWYDEYLTYDGGGNLAGRSVPSPTGSGWAYSEFTSDLFGRQVTAYDSLEIAAGDEVDYRVYAERAGGVTTAWYYDPLGELRELDRDTGRAGTRTIEREAGLTTLETDENDFEKRVVYNMLGFPTKVRLGKGTLKLLGTYTYDAMGQLASATDGRSTTTEWTRDAAGRLTRVDANDLGWREYTYVGRSLDTQTDSAGGTADWGRDLLGRPESVTVSDPISGSVTYDWQYDDDWIGAVWSVGASYGHVEYEHGLRGELTKSTYFDSGDVEQTSFAYTSDFLGRVTERYNSSTGRTWNTIWGSGGVPTLLQQDGANLVTSTFDVRGRLTQWAAAKVKYQATYTAANQVPSEVKLLSVAGATKRKRGYVWQSNDLLQSVTDATTGAGVTTTFTYDNYKQLVAAAGGWSEGFVWDDAGNPTSVTRPDGSIWIYSARTLPTGNRLANRANGPTVETMTYDAAGRVVTLGNAGSKAHYDYDGLGRLRRVWGQGTGYAAGCNGAFAPRCVVLVLDWDGGGQVVRRSDGDPVMAAVVKTMILEDWTKDSSGVETEEFGIPGYALGRYVGSTRNWNFQEADGHVSGLFDDGANVKSTRNLSVYGSVRSSTGTPSRRFGEHGLWFDLNGKLASAGARHFAPQDGQFLQPDPAMLTGPSIDQILNPLNLNSYRYARNAPTSYADRNGECADVLLSIVDVAVTVDTIHEYYQPNSTVTWGQVKWSVAGTVVSIVAPLAGEALAVRYAPKLLASAETVVGGTKYGDAAIGAVRGALGITDDAAAFGEHSLGAAEGAYGVALGGGKNAGFLKQAEGMTSAQRSRASASLQRQIEKHEAKIADPANAIDNWSSLDPRYQQGLLNHWQGEIKTFSEQQEILNALE